MLILCDIDGTAANINHRRHLVEGKKDGKKVSWPRFFDEMVHDTPNEWCQTLLAACDAGITIRTNLPSLFGGYTEKELLAMVEKENL